MELGVRDARHGSSGSDVGRAGLYQDRVGGHTVGRGGGQRDLSTASIEQLHSDKALEDARGRCSIAVEDPRGKLTAGQGADPAEDGVQVSRPAGAGVGRDLGRRRGWEQHAGRSGTNPRDRRRLRSRGFIAKA